MPKPALTGWQFTDAKNQVTCPKCRAPAGENCRTPKGRKAWPPHSERLAEVVKEFGVESFTREAGKFSFNAVLGEVAKTLKTAFDKHETVGDTKPTTNLKGVRE